MTTLPRPCRASTSRVRVCRPLQRVRRADMPAQPAVRVTVSQRGEPSRAQVARDYPDAHLAGPSVVHQGEDPVATPGLVNGANETRSGAVQRGRRQRPDLVDQL